MSNWIDYIEDKPEKTSFRIDWKFVCAFFAAILVIGIIYVCSLIPWQILATIFGFGIVGVGVILYYIYQPEPKPEEVSFTEYVETSVVNGMIEPKVIYQQIVPRQPTRAEDQITYLERLAELKRRGAISESEYNQTKWGILSKNI